MNDLIELVMIPVYSHNLKTLEKLERMFNHLSAVQIKV